MINISSYRIRIFYIVLGLFFFNIQIFAEEPGAPSGLIIEVANNYKEVIVVDDSHPEFGWIMNDKDKNEYQTAYQILVASTRENLDKFRGNMWDSGKIKSDESTNVSYAYNAKPLIHR